MDYSRSRSGLWRKGDTSGHHQSLHRIDVDCDRDALRFTVTQNGGGKAGAAFCHLGTLTCWGEPRGLRHLEGTLAKRLVDAPAGSYTKRLFDDEMLLRDKLAVFGGFFDNLRDVKYYNDLYLFDLGLYKWSRVPVEPGASVPLPRSGCQFVAHPSSDAAIVFGGYFKKKK